MVSTSKLLFFRLPAFDYRHGDIFLRESAIHAEHALRLFLRVLISCMGRVALLPEELRSPQKQPRTHFPPDDVPPLIEQQRQVAIRLNPISKRVPNDGLRRRPNDQRFLELRTTSMGDDCDFRRKTLDVFRFFLKKTFWNEERKICVLVPRFLEHAVKSLLHFFPDRVAVRSNDHAAFDGCVICQFCCGNHIGIPSRVVFTALGDLCFGHNLAIIALAYNGFLRRCDGKRYRRAAVHNGFRRSYRETVHTGRRPYSQLRQGPWRPWRAAVYPRHLSNHVSWPPLDDTPIQRLRLRGGYQRTFPLPSETWSDRLICCLPSSNVDGLRLGSSAVGGRGRQMRRGDRFA